MARPEPTDDALNAGTAPDAAGLAPTRAPRGERFAERVYDSLFHAIMTGQLAPGARLPAELSLATRFQVSRPVVRQALDRLRAEGLLQSVRGSGSYVAPQPGAAAALAQPTAADLSHILHGLELRLMVEPECAHLAALRRQGADLARMRQMLDGFEQAHARGDVAHHFDYGFHEAIAQATANPRLVAVLKMLEYDVSRAVNLWRHLAHMKPWRRTQEALDEHRALYALIESQDAEAARRCMRAHVENARVRMMQLDG